ncbi:AraC family transcriptional regulator [Actinoplanes sp. NBRC 103695]|uniref:AraC family transcriptional regulator n=1 Tax=Actinoplanes sp. NBRC 103695 TaxID=3032202 RepID=UPI0024A3FDB2|nr:AraC family transcriptional regulator [Actinoplanes sp. NBRC 103695]GLY97274.1 AraC family transcriptional regulator [Actinoplanes sp. NBRC 103695]
MDLISDVVGAGHAGPAFACRVRAVGAWGFRFPSNTGMGFHAVLDGAGWVAAPGAKPVRVQRGDIVLVPHGAEHVLSHTVRRSMTGWETLWAPGPVMTGPADIDFLLGCYKLDHSQVHRFMHTLPAVVRIRPDYDNQPDLRALLDLLATDASLDRPGGTATRAALVDLILVHVLRQVGEATRTGGSAELADPGVAAALDQIRESPHRPWTVPKLAQVAGMSRTVFSERFASLVGEPPMRYLIGWRLTRAARLLRETQVPLATIARQVGYANGYAFAGAFRRQYGVAPGHYRRQQPLATERPSLTGK